MSDAWPRRLCVTAPSKLLMRSAVVLYYPAPARRASTSTLRACVLLARTLPPSLNNTDLLYYLHAAIPHRQRFL
jgi:hypothetical protein